MKHLILYAHPNPKSLNHAIMESAKQACEDAGHEVRVRDLYALNFQPVLTGEDLVGFQQGKTPADIAEEQTHVAWADMITMIYPVWWIGPPAILKGYIDRVFSFGFAYKFDKGKLIKMLAGKKTMVINTGGESNAHYEKNGVCAAMEKAVRAGIEDFCGVSVASYHYFGSIPILDESARKNILSQIKSLY